MAVGVLFICLGCLCSFIVGGIIALLNQLVWPNLRKCQKSNSRGDLKNDGSGNGVEESSREKKEKSVGKQQEEEKQEQSSSNPPPPTINNGANELSAQNPMEMGRPNGEKDVGQQEAKKGNNGKKEKSTPNNANGAGMPPPPHCAPIHHGGSKCGQEESQSPKPHCLPIPVTYYGRQSFPAGEYKSGHHSAIPQNGHHFCSDYDPINLDQIPRYVMVSPMRFVADEFEQLPPTQYQEQMARRDVEFYEEDLMVIKRGE